MWCKAIWLLPVGVIVAFLLVRSSDRGFTMPETFPALDDAGAETDAVPPPGGTEPVSFGSGCFWCTEAVFQPIKGVTTVVSGYCGGSVPDPHLQPNLHLHHQARQVVQVTFEPAVVSYPELLEVLWRSHDPTTRDRPGLDTGPQYRSSSRTPTGSGNRPSGTSR